MPESRKIAVDVRMTQALLMLSILGTGALLKDFSLGISQVASAFAGGLFTQYACMRRLNLKHVGYKSAVITCLGVSLLLRSDSLYAHALSAAAAVLSKFVCRISGKHIFNPANLGVLLGLTLLPGTWVSAGQWGSDTAIAFWLAAFGSVSLLRLRFQLMTWCFLTFYIGIFYCHRMLWMGYETAILLHHLQSGALLLFAFFMISDPKTAPNHPAAQVLQSLIVAACAYVWQFELYFTNALLWSLLLASFLVPLWDRIFTAPAFSWRRTGGNTDEIGSNPATYFGGSPQHSSA
ncbi:MAG: RnfABCDGE type electron transport complex subunit D [Bdellovibrionales bacterium]|nr:RnfABCDGE type electron transport complex subunit D [Bdellovibrionales bacterium]